MSDRVAELILATSPVCGTWLRATDELPDRQLTPGTINAAISEQQYLQRHHTFRPGRPLSGRSSRSFEFSANGTSKRIQDDGQVLNGQTHAHGAEHYSGCQRVLKVFIDAGQRCARIIVVKDHEGLPLVVMVQPGFDFLDSVRFLQPARRFPLRVEADSNETNLGGPEHTLDLLTGEHLSPA